MDSHKEIAALPLKRLNRIAWLLDNSIRVPGLNYRIGIDPLLGLLPGIGEAAGALLSIYIVAEGVRGGLPRAIVGRMAFNVALEILVGSIPLAGDLFDMTWKANARNVRLIERYAAAPQKSAATSAFFLWSIIIGLLLLSALVIYLTVRLAIAVWSGLTG